MCGAGHTPSSQVYGWSVASKSFGFDVRRCGWSATEKTGGLAPEQGVPPVVEASSICVEGDGVSYNEFQRATVFFEAKDWPAR
jgi:hypothetical protein